MARCGKSPTSHNKIDHHTAMLVGDDSTPIEEAEEAIIIEAEEVNHNVSTLHLMSIIIIIIIKD